MSFQVHRYHDICAGHRVHGHESKCAHFHGHNYRVHFTVEAATEKTAIQPLKGDPRYDSERVKVRPNALDDIGRVIDFSAIKQYLCQWLEDNWDHKMLLWEHDPEAMLMQIMDPQGVVLVPFNPTAENMARYLVETVGPEQLHETGVVLVKVTIDETAKCSASFTKEGR